jgi:hypothetical protein
VTDQRNLIPNVIGRIDPIIDAIRAGDYAETLRLTEAETARLTEIRDRLDQEWRQAQGKSLAAYSFGEYLKDAGPGVMDRLKAEVA